MSDNSEPDFLSEEGGILTLDTLISEQPSLWDKAHAVITGYAKSLRRVTYGGKKYLVSPSAPVKRSVNTAKIAIAVLIDGKEKSGDASLYLVKNDDMETRVMILRYDHVEDSPLVRVDTFKPVRPEGFDEVIEKIEAVTEEVERERASDERRKKRRRKRHFEDFGVLYVAAAVLALWVSVPVGITMNDDASYREHMATTVAQWDKANETYVVGSSYHNTIRIGEEDALASGEYYPDLGIPTARTVDAIGQRPRSFTVETNSCKHGNTVTDVGYIKGDQVLLAVTDAPDNVIRVRVDEGGEVDICARESEKDQVGNDDTSYTVALQPQPAANFAASVSYYDSITSGGRMVPESLMPEGYTPDMHPELNPGSFYNPELDEAWENAKDWADDHGTLPPSLDEVRESLYSSRYAPSSLSEVGKSIEEGRNALNEYFPPSPPSCDPDFVGSCLPDDGIDNGFDTIYIGGMGNEHPPYTEADIQRSVEQAIDWGLPRQLVEQAADAFREAHGVKP